MTVDQLKLKMQAVFQAGNAVSVALKELAGDDPQGLLGVHVFVANQHLQDCMNRVSNLGALLVQATDENVTQTVDKAIKAGELTVLQGGETKG